jgi:hypothetical protein
VAPREEAAAGGPAPDPAIEALVGRIAERILQQLGEAK